MALPFFYNREINTTSTMITLEEEASRHIVQVLRMKTGEKLHLTDGNGNLFLCSIVDDHKKKCAVKIISHKTSPVPAKKVTIAISLVKNNSRFEWFLEKATEIGVNEIIPLICSRTEKSHFRYDRMNQILISAMLQSEQAWLPVLHEPVEFKNAIIIIDKTSLKYIAHCIESESKVQLFSEISGNGSSILIGPEGDFTAEEIQQALDHGFMAVALGETRLRTETAGIVAATFLCNL